MDETTAVDTLYRAEVVGSMLRPPELVEARAELRAERLDPAEYRAIEDRAVDEALRIQEDAGVDVATDGEMRRDIFFDFFISGMSGLSPVPGKRASFRDDDGNPAMEVQIPFSVTDKVIARECPGVAEFRYAQPRTRLPLKVTLPSPMLLVLGFWTEQSRDAYPDPLGLAEDSRAAVTRWIEELIAVGCRYIQIDAPDLAEAHADPLIREQFAGDAGMATEEYLSVSRELISGLGRIERPAGVTLGLHLCKGNGTQAWVAAGGYDALAETTFPQLDGYDVVHLEYDDDRSGSFDPLAALPDHVVAALGLVSTKWTHLEDPEQLRHRVAEAARFHPMDRLAVGPQCGFASASETAEQRKVTPRTQFDKLRLVAQLARTLWT
jgi:5-methyltetrahydropteroyltriglutamate--homocysteine methyltransferase